MGLDTRSRPMLYVFAGLALLMAIAIVMAVVSEG